MKEAVNAAIIRNKKILLVKKEKTWILPGGKPSPCDRGSSIDCLRRKISAELPSIKLNDIFYYKSFQGTTPPKREELDARVYLADFKGNEKITGEEISESKWLGIDEILKYKISDISLKIIDSLKEGEYL